MEKSAPAVVRAVLREKVRRTESVESYRFSPAERIPFLPGQFGQVFLDAGDLDNPDLNRYLSFSSSPTREYVEVTKKLSDSEFSGRLKSLEAGREVLLRAPMGKSFFRDEYRKVGFLIGGIGITPVISIIEYIVEKDLATDVMLFYSNRSEEEIAFRRELDSWSAARPAIRVFCFVTRVEPKDAKCAFGRMNREILLEHIKDQDERHFYVFGPPKMVETMAGLCREIGCPEKALKTESFAGY